MEIKERSFNPTNTSTDGYYLYISNEHELLRDARFEFDTLNYKDLSKYGSLFVNILNKRHEILNKIDEVISKLSRCSNHEEVLNIYTNNYLKKSILKIDNNCDAFINRLIDKSLSKIIGDEVSIYDNESEFDIGTYFSLIELSEKYNTNVPLDKLVMSNKGEKDLLILAKLPIEKKEKTIKQLLNEYHNSTLILNDGTYKITRFDKVRNICDKLQLFFDDVSSIFSNFTNFLEASNSDMELIKNYLLYTTDIPKYSYAVFFTDMDINIKKYIVYELPSYDYTYYLKNKDKVSQALVFKKHMVENLIQLLDVYVESYIQGNHTILKCENCGKYFLKTTRKDEKYCNNVFKVVNGKEMTCKEYAPSMKHRKKISDDVLNKSIYNFRNKIYNRKTRTADLELKMRLDEFLNNFNSDYTKKIGKLNEKELLEWFNKKNSDYNNKFNK